MSGKSCVPTYSGFIRKVPTRRIQVKVEFVYGQAKLSGIFDFVFVSADLRAHEESVDGRNTILGRILERAIDRQPAAEELRRLFERFSKDQASITATHIDTQLRGLAKELTSEVAAFTPGKSVNLASVPMEPRPTEPKVGVTIIDSTVETPVERQGHGFQHALLVSALKLLARRGTQAQTGTICLAIEEPELYQHPTQAKAFASVLRTLAHRENDRLQVCYATHSPFFVEPRYFDQIRRVTRRQIAGAWPIVTVAAASLASVSRRLQGFEQEQAIVSRWDQVCNKSLPEALFADAVIVVEGDSDRAILEGASGDTNELALSGIAVAPAQSKTKVFLPHAILSELDILVLVIVDNDSGIRTKQEAEGKNPSEIDRAEKATIEFNRRLLRHFGLAEEDFPVGTMSKELVMMRETLESMMEKDWPDWEGARDAIVAEGRGVKGKNAATYELAARECEVPPGGEIATLLDAVRQMAQAA